VARTSIIDAHTHIYRTQAIGRQAMTSLNPNIEWNGTPEELRTCMAAFGISHSVGLVVTPTREMHEKAVASIPADVTGAERRLREAEMSGQMLARMGRNNQWGSAIGRDIPRDHAICKRGPRADGRRQAAVGGPRIGRERSEGNQAVADAAPGPCERPAAMARV